jgi:peptide/nickel transport system substrate-binding protein
MYRRRGRLFVVAAVATIAVVASSCSGTSNNQGSSSAPQGGTLRIGTSSGLISPNPFVGFNQDDYSTWMYIYPSLLQYDTTTSTYDYMPSFATDWQRSDDGLTVTFHTVPNAKWSDGQALTADDVAFTFNMIKKYADGPTGAWAGSVTFLKTIEATDANTVVATYDQPSGTALFDLGLTPILPPQVWSQYATGDGKALKTFPNVPENGQPLVGGGPFVMTEYKKNDIALFEANPNWYGKKPSID